jgi:hypothetical protein
MLATVVLDPAISVVYVPALWEATPAAARPRRTYRSGVGAPLCSVTRATADVEQTYHPAPLA